MILEQATNLNLGLSEDDSAYDLTFITKKLAVCSSHLEKLSDMQMELTKIMLQVTPPTFAAASLLKLKEGDFKSSDEYEEIARSKKRAWLREQLGKLTENAERWMQLRRAVSEVREAVGERSQTIKRLDSDLRLHARLYEARVAAGATPRLSFEPGSSGRDVSID